MSTVDDLVRQVQQLENATTDLLDATNVSKQTLDEAVDSATGSAGSAKTDAATATEAKNEGVQARNEAVKARDDAEAIAYEGEATTEPGGGKIPVAYADGQIDSGWLPLLQAMYPYSGVIGSVNKLDVLAFGQSENWVNRTQLVAGVRFNIAGRFVEQKTHKSIPLPEAESTAERAIAFDDIFIDWNGNIDTYRSITPHRTTTGYDSDAIATEHGYTKIQNGLYRTGDTYVLLLGRVARRNQGAYHPLWNPEGTSGYRRHDGNDNASVNRWYSSNADKPESSNQCFLIHPEGPVTTNSLAGSIAGGSARNTRPDDKYYDAIYADDFTPLYFSAKNIVDRQALLFDSFNRAVAGETFMGAEGTTQMPNLMKTGEFEVVSAAGVEADYTTRTVTFTNTTLGVKLETLRYIDGNSYVYIRGNCTSITGGAARFIVYGVGSLDGNVAIIDSTGTFEVKGRVKDLVSSNFNKDNSIVLYSNENGTTLTIEDLFVSVSHPSISARP